MLWGGSGNDILNGGAGADSVHGEAGDDSLTGGTGDDTITGGAGNDNYLFGRGDGKDLILNGDSSSTNDRVIFGSGISADQLWFARVGSDLHVSIIGTGDEIDFNGWYTDSANQVDAFKVAEGDLLMASQVDQLCSAMAAFSAPPSGQLTLSTEQHAALDPVLAASWI